ncbi:neuronal acetylcholine receptor subunit beta-3-like [Ostrea edulis]|uniref:neuronal acetylcholine receptor subunit beta-3-like n=1 Tax=Ostrea edulis TaxID=37623 RepID=UPI0024AEE520|nr:neuronal acetylcholine receptor subunit beta-3-like [Ostrea edulis]
MRIRMVIVCFWITTVTSKTNENTRTLINDIFTNYSSKVRPVINQRDPLSLDVSFYLSSINEVDEVKGKLVTTGCLSLTWTDELLRWTPADYNGTDIIFIPQNDIWKPDLVLKNGFKKFEELGGSFYYLSVFHDGTVAWLPFNVFESRCSMDITYFPFDKQTCDIKFLTWSHYIDQIDIQRSSDGIQFYEYEVNGVWDLIDTSSEIHREQKKSQIKFTLTLRRKPLYYVMNIILPVVFLGYLNILVFVIPVDTGEKMSFSVTVFLSFAVFLTIISTLLPTSSENTPIIAIYLIIQLVYGVKALIISAFQLRLNHRHEAEEIPMFWIKVVQLQSKLRCKSTQIDTVDMYLNKEEENSVKKIDEDSPDVIIGWNHVASSIDFLAFWYFMFTNIFITVVVFSVLATPSHKA